MHALEDNCVREEGPGGDLRSLRTLPPSTFPAGARPARKISPALRRRMGCPRRRTKARRSHSAGARVGACVIGLVDPSDKHRAHREHIRVAYAQAQQVLSVFLSIRFWWSLHDVVLPSISMHDKPVAGVAVVVVRLIAQSARNSMGATTMPLHSIVLAKSYLLHRHGYAGRGDT